jgi:xylulose-5-phosphate/fructose-6-phosphate phosphoketolase
MTVLNELDRFHLVLSALDRLPAGEREAALAVELREKLRAHRIYIEQHGQDMPEIREWRWPG